MSLIGERRREEVRRILQDLLVDLASDIVKSTHTPLANLAGNTLKELLRGMVQFEVYVCRGRKIVDMVFHGKLIVEIKSQPGEFDEAYYKLLEEYLQCPETVTVEYVVITNYDLWRIYRVERRDSALELKSIAKDVELASAVEILRTQILPSILGGVKLPARPEVVGRFFTRNIDEAVSTLKEVFENVRENPAVKPLYEAYRKILEVLYGRASEEFLEDMFIKHTLMHMIVHASLSKTLGVKGDPVDVCSGILLGVDVALPYLNWWRVVYSDESMPPRLREKLGEVAAGIVFKASLIDWEHSSIGEVEDVFRSLYELLVEPEVRRKIGEYYTPLWIVEYMLNEFNLKGKLVLDPFCGSGTFLVKAFYKKIMEGESPEEAYKSLVGFDVNPLAVSIARAELIIAYSRVAGRTPDQPPRVYHADVFLSFAKRRELPTPPAPGMWVPEVESLFDSAWKYLAILVNFNLAPRLKGASRALLEAFSWIEKALTLALYRAYDSCTRNQCLAWSESEARSYLAEVIDRELVEYISEYSKNTLELSRLIMDSFLRHARELKPPLALRLAELIAKYKESGEWGLVIASVYVPLALLNLRVDLILTNPPWIKLTEFKASYAVELRRYLGELLEKRLKLEKKNITSILNGSDVATVALAMAVNTVDEGVGFVMNREQVFYHKASMRAGILAAYAVLKDFNGELKLVDVDYDAFQHGIYPALVIAKKGLKKEPELLVVRLSSRYRENYTKSLTLKPDILEIQKLNIRYEDYVSTPLLYFTTSSGELARALSVEKVIPMGLYIRGLLGGELKEARKGRSYAGLVLSEHRYAGGGFEFKLYGTTSKLRVPRSWLENYRVGVYELIYMSEVNPFKLARTLPVLLSEGGLQPLREFLHHALEYNKHSIKLEDEEKIRRLLEEIAHPGRLELMKPESYYVVYRASRVFTSLVVKPASRNLVLHSTVASIECREEDKAYYYAAVLNYLAYKAITEGRSFIRTQFARPLLAVALSGLSWSSVNKDTRMRIAELSRELSRRIEARGYSNQASALKHIYDKYSEFKEIVRILDEYVEKHNSREALEKSLDLVSFPFSLFLIASTH